ncbi:hypothetical protein E0H89_03445 [Acinetobacter sp. ANC 3781]|uniref:hypothetical protein n=1 Tax=Acinetobacter sp. ANC 3781 TaxID=2529835 RepID=UPI00103E9A4A|nr:hypothetical protein [Acinetobacter sp. ANC 3781]TCB79322.1 hypothetical protein E0H89_03445 [Acinetobacter sp. ANC 3781]
MSNDYTTDPPPITPSQLYAISDNINQLRQSMEKLADLPQKIDRMSVQFEQLQKDQQKTVHDLQKARDGFEEDLDRTKSSLRAEMKQIRQDTEVKHKEVDLQIRVLSESKTKIDNTTNIVRWGGIALLGALGVAWNTQTGKTDAMTTRSMENAQKIQVLEKQSDQSLRTLEEIRNKLYERNYRESANEISR